MAFRLRVRSAAALALGLSLPALAGSACSASSSKGGGGAGGAGAAGGAGGASGGGTGGTLIEAGSNDAKLDPDAACAQFTKEAEKAAAAILIVLDRSSSMSTNNKWLAAQTAIQQAMDSDAFDELTLGLLAYPAVAPVPSPQCLALLAPTVSCGIPPFANVPLKDTGLDKSTVMNGVRREIRDWLLSNSFDTTGTDASPGYEAMERGIAELQNLGLDGKRLMLFITDGGFSCTSLKNGGTCWGQPIGTEAVTPDPNRPGYCDGACWDWEYPDTTLQLLSDAYNHAVAPVSSFIIGVPGSNSNGELQGSYATAPYSMRLALSAYAYAGSPTTVPPDCDGTAFNRNGGDPSKPCHYDMTTQGFFDAASLANIIEEIRGAVLDCTFALPDAPDGEVINPNKVNVSISTDGTSTSLKRRSDPADPCAADGCWDYDPSGQVELVGKACADVKAANASKVDILVGCDTIPK